MLKKWSLGGLRTKELIVIALGFLVCLNGAFVLGAINSELSEEGKAAGLPTRKPNFVFILADDLGWRDLSCQGSNYYQSPHLDGLASSGMKFTQGYATCQVCSPSRASIMTGKFPARHGITDWIGAASGEKWNRNDKLLPAEYLRQLPAEDTTIAEALRAAGYKTCFAGKWHLGGKGSLPTDHGFDFNYGGFEAGSPKGGFFAPYNNPHLTDGPPGESLPIRLADETVKFIESHSDQPFFAYLSFYSVHAPIQTTELLWRKYRDIADSFPESDERFMIDRTLPVRQVQDCPIYAGMIESMDDAVGRVLKCLDEKGLAENTVVIFTSDNGGVSSGDAYATSNLPFRGGKGRQWEGGIREPFFIRAPGIAPPNSTCDVPVTGADFYPTMLELAGLPLDFEQHVDGQSLLPLLKGNSISDRALFWHYPHYGNQGGEPSSIVRRGEWKLIHYYEDGRDELYNLSSDPAEQDDVSASNGAVVTRLRSELDGWLAETDAKIPHADARFDAEKAAQQKMKIATELKPRLEKTHAEYLSPTFKPNANWWKSSLAEGVRD